MPSSGLRRRVALVKTDVSEDRIAPIIRVIRIGEIGKILAVTSNLIMLQRNGLYYVFLRSMLWFLDTANFVPCSPILVTLMMEGITCL
jgi:hypothetical protein